MDDTGHWVRVHSDEDENKSDEELITRNLLREMLEKAFKAPVQVDEPEKNREWWEAHPELDALINPTAEVIAAEFGQE